MFSELKAYQDILVCKYCSKYSNKSNCNRQHSIPLLKSHSTCCYLIGKDKVLWQSVGLLVLARKM